MADPDSERKQRSLEDLTSIPPLAVRHPRLFLLVMAVMVIPLLVVLFYSRFTGATLSPDNLALFYGIPLAFLAASIGIYLFWDNYRYLKKAKKQPHT